jgi:hypothetical protein
MIHAAASLVLMVATAPDARGAPALPFDEQTLERIYALNQAISSHYEELMRNSEEIEVQREMAKAKLEAVESDLERLDQETSELRRSEIGDKTNALRMLEEHRIEANSRHLEALAERHAIDVDATQSFERHASAILLNLERLASALEESGRLGPEADEQTAQQSMRSLQQGTAIALSVLEEWGTLTRDDPRFRALWATSKVLSRNVRRLSGANGIRSTVGLVRERTFVVRSLIDQARALRAALDQQGLLLQVAAQNQMLRFHFNRLGAINGMELPDLEIEDTTSQILAHIEEEPFAVDDSEFLDPLVGFDDCAYHGACQ